MPTIRAARATPFPSAAPAVDGVGADEGRKGSSTLLGTCWVSIMRTVCARASIPAYAPLWCRGHVVWDRTGERDGEGTDPQGARERIAGETRNAPERRDSGAFSSGSGT